MPIVHGFGHGVIHQGPPLLVSFSPILYNPALWLDASDQSTMYQERTGESATTLVASDADPVGTWKDKSGNGRHVTAASDAARPTYKVGVQNGQSVTLFDGVNDVLTTSSLASVFAGTNVPMSVFAVVQATANTGRSFFGMGDDGNVYPYIICRIVNSTTSVFSFRNPSIISGNANGPGTTSLNTSYVYSGTYDGANITAFVNGLAGTPAAFTGTQTYTGATVGSQRRTGAENYHTGYIMELIVYPSALSTSQRQQVERYLSAKWGITLS